MRFPNIYFSLQHTAHEHTHLNCHESPCIYLYFSLIVPPTTTTTTGNSSTATLIPTACTHTRLPMNTTTITSNSTPSTVADIPPTTLTVAIYTTTSTPSTTTTPPIKFSCTYRHSHQNKSYDINSL